MKYIVRYFMVFDPIAQMYSVFDSEGARMIMACTDPSAIVASMSALEIENLHNEHRN